MGRFLTARLIPGTYSEDSSLEELAGEDWLWPFNG